MVTMAGDLDGLEGAVVEVALELGEGGHDGRVAHHECHPPPRHGEALGQGVQLHRHVLGAGHLQDRGRLEAVEGGVGVGEIVHQHDVALWRQGLADSALVEAMQLLLSGTPDLTG